MAARRFPTFVSICLAALCLAALCVAWLAAPAGADDDATKREITSVKKKIQELQVASKRAQEEGRQDEAYELATRARDLTQRLEAFFMRRAKAENHASKNRQRGDRGRRNAKRQAKGRAKAKRAHPEKVLRDLSRAIDALKTIGGHDELIHHLANTIEKIKHTEHAKHDRRRRGADKPKLDRHEREGRHDKGEEDKERAGLRRRVEILRLALPALREGDKGELVRIIERAIHTGELMLEGRNDEEAREVMERTPSLPELAEVLHVSAKLWKTFGRDENAEKVRWLSRYYRKRSRGREHEERARPEGEARAEQAKDRHRAHRKQDGRNRREHAEREAHERREREEGGHRRDADLEELREHLHQLRRQLEEMQRHLKKLSRER